MKELRIIIKVKNNILLSLREELGFSQSVLSKKIGISVQKISDYECLRHYPIANGDWNDDAYTLSSFFHKEPEEIFPEALEKINWSTKIIKTGTNELEHGNPFLKIEEKQKVKDIGLSLSAFLTTRERMVLEHRFGLNGEDEKTLNETGIEMDASRERIRQIECKAFRKLRHPANSILLKRWIK